MNETKIPHDNKDIGKDFITKKEMKSKTNYLYSRTGRQFKKTKSIWLQLKIVIIFKMKAPFKLEKKKRNDSFTSVIFFLNSNLNLYKN